MSTATEDLQRRVRNIPERKEFNLDRTIGNEMFLHLVDYQKRLHAEKAAGYSGSDQPDTWSNFREATAWGLSPLDGCLTRLGDKYRRSQNVYRNADNDQVGEPFPRTMIDLAAYSLIAICLWAEEQNLSWEDLETILRGVEA